MMPPLTRVRPRPGLCRDLAPRPTSRRPCTANYISHNAHRGGQGQAQRLEPGLRRQRPASAVFLSRQPGKGPWEGAVACAVAMSVSAGGRGPANLNHQSGPGRTPVTSRGSGRGQ